MVRRYLALALVLFTAVLLQTVLSGWASLFGVSPDLVLMVVISLALVEGPVSGAAAGFFGGLVRDLLLSGPHGLSALTYTIVGYAVGRLRPFIRTTSVLVPVVGILAGSLAGGFLQLIFAVVLGEAISPVGDRLRIIVIAAVFNSLLAPFFYPAIHRLALAMRRESAFR